MSRFLSSFYGFKPWHIHQPSRSSVKSTSRTGLGYAEQKAQMSGNREDRPWANYSTKRRTNTVR